MNPKKFSEAMSKIDSKYIDEAIRYKKSGKKHNYIRWAASAACLALIIAVTASIAARTQNQIKLSDNSSNVTVCYTSSPIYMQSSSSLIFLTEEELFTHFNTAIFKGRIRNLNNIELNFNGDKNYRAIAEIEVETVYRGSCDIGDKVSVLLPCPIMEDYWVEDTDTVSVMQAGMTGIFMPIVYDDTSVREQNGARLALKDIADYGFADGVRYAFLETQNGLVFSRSSYESISDATTLDEIENYILNMIGQQP